MLRTGPSGKTTSKSQHTWPRKPQESQKNENCRSAIGSPGHDPNLIVILRLLRLFAATQFPVRRSRIESARYDFVAALLSVLVLLAGLGENRLFSFRQAG